MPYIKKTNRQRNQREFINSLTGEIDIITSTNDIAKRISNISDLKTKALASVLFITGARSGEIIKKLKTHQIKMTRDKIGDKMITAVHFINVPTLKKRDGRANPRTIPVIYDEDHRPFINIIGAYIKLNNLGDDDYLFTLTKRRYRQLIEKHLGINLHRFRHIRNSLLVIEKNVSGEVLTKLNNWSSSAVAQEYVHLNVKDLTRHMI